MSIVISLHIAYDNPQRIGIITVDTATGKITSNNYVKPPAFGNYLEFAIIRASYLAIERNLPFSLEHVAIWLTYFTPEYVSQAYDRVMQRLFDEGYRAADDGGCPLGAESALTHPRQRAGYAHYWQREEMIIA